MQVFSAFRNSFSFLVIIAAIMVLPGCFPCMNVECENGICNDGTCECFDGYYGSECQYSDATSGYDCVSGSCVYASDNATYSTFSDCENNCGSTVCEYDHFMDAVNCLDGANFPVSYTWCCSSSVPYYCPETESCYPTCEAADAACSSARVVTGQYWAAGSGYVCASGNCDFVTSGASYTSLALCQSACSGGGNAGYVCASGNCTFVSSGATYTSLSQCQTACSGGGSSGYDCTSGSCVFVNSGADYATQSECEANCGSSNCPWDLNLPCLSIVTVYDNGCGNGSTFRVSLTNNCGTALKVYWCLRDVDGTWNTTADGNFNQGIAPGGTNYHYVCEGTGEYNVWTMPVATFYANSCTWPSCQ